MSTVVNVNSSSEGIGVTTHTVALPADIVADRRLLVIIGCHSAQTIGGTLTSEYTEVIAPVTTHGDTFAVYTKVATGSEGASVTFTTGSNRRSTHASVQIQAQGAGIGASTVASGTSTAPDPGSLAPAFDPDLWFAVMASALGLTGLQSVTGFPTNYVGDTQVQSLDGTIAYAYRELAAASEDPDAFTISSDAWIAYTIGIEEGAGGSAPSSGMLTGVGF